MSHKNISELRQIVEGWKNLFIPDDEIEKLAVERKLVCIKCPHKKKMICGKCDCPLEAKIRSTLADCPDNRWER